MSQTRRLAAILAADVAGYSRLMGADEEDTHERLKAHFAQLLDPKIVEHQGRIPGLDQGTKTSGGGPLVEFASIVDAVRCAVAVQQAMRWQNSILLSLKPILAKKAVDPGELSVVVGHDGIAECDSLSGNEQIVTADQPADLFEPGADLAIDGVGWHLEWENVEDAEHSVELHRQLRRCPLRGPVA